MTRTVILVNEVTDGDVDITERLSIARVGRIETATALYHILLVAGLVTRLGQRYKRSMSLDVLLNNGSYKVQFKAQVIHHTGFQTPAPNWPQMTLNITSSRVSQICFNKVAESPISHR